MHPLMVFESPDEPRQRNNLLPTTKMGEQTTLVEAVTCSRPAQQAGGRGGGQIFRRDNANRQQQDRAGGRYFLAGVTRSPS
jgi:hypothetical protein